MFVMQNLIEVASSCDYKCDCAPYSRIHGAQPGEEKE